MPNSWSEEQQTGIDQKPWRDRSILRDRSVSSQADLTWEFSMRMPKICQKCLEVSKNVWVCVWSWRSAGWKQNLAGFPSWDGWNTRRYMGPVHLLYQYWLLEQISGHQLVLPFSSLETDIDDPRQHILLQLIVAVENGSLAEVAPKKQVGDVGGDLQQVGIWQESKITRFFN